ncbi:MAG: AtpZ/AtpI family protein [Propionibacteriaceae bacterium]|nr:AtpZ/AtpI family protein [Propionibacteriaceae bacterium]
MSGQGGADQGYRILSIMIAGLLAYGGLGWLLDRWLGTAWFLPIGLVVGVALGIYLVVVKFGRSQ